MSGFDNILVDVLHLTCQTLPILSLSSPIAYD